jgi:hypothetical protein
MDGRHHAEEQVRLAVEALPDAPIRWERVARKARRRRWIVLAALVSISASLSLLVATGFIAGKSALDPSYTPPLVSKGHISATFDEPAFGHGLTRLSHYRAASAPGQATTQSLVRDLGYVFTVSLGGGDLDHGHRLIPRWRIRRRGTSTVLPLAAIPSRAGSHGRGAGDEDSYVAWIEEPAHAGQFVVDFSLMSQGEAVVSQTSAPFHVVTRDLLIPYRAPTYKAGVPRGWRSTSDYAHASPHRFVTKLQGPHGMSILIDTTLDQSGDPAESARYMAQRFEDVEEDYKPLSLGRRSLGGPAFEWSFELGSQVSTDIFFYRGKDGYAVLAEGPATHFREARLVARDIVRSLKDSG